MPSPKKLHLSTSCKRQRIKNKTPNRRKMNIKPTIKNDHDNNIPPQSEQTAALVIPTINGMAKRRNGYLPIRSANVSLAFKCFSKREFPLSDQQP